MIIDYENETGLSHQATNSKCQDHIAIRTDEAHMTTVICDGAGGLIHGDTAAQILSETLADFLHKNAFLFYHCSADFIRHKTVRLIHATLAKTADEKNTVECELGCTILAVSLDKTGRFISLHLGDGRIIMTEEEKIFHSVSSPMNGLNKNETYLTMNCDMSKYLRITHCHGGTKQVLLWTDGMDLIIQPLLTKISHGVYQFNGKADGKEILAAIRKNSLTSDDDYTIGFMEAF